MEENLEKKLLTSALNHIIEDPSVNSTDLTLDYFKWKLSNLFSFPITINQLSEKKFEFALKSNFTKKILNIEINIEKNN